MRAFIHKDDLGKEIEETDIPEDMVEDAKRRTAMIEAACEQDEE